MPRVEVVLVRPETPVNIGATARIIRNTGLDALVLVAPGDFRTVECWRTAWGAQEVLEQAVCVPTLSEALRDSSYAVALSGKRGGDTPVLDVRDLASQVAGLGDGLVASLVFGPETSGLSDEEMALCGRRATIPVDDGQPSLNLSHAVMVCAYEVFRAGHRPRSEPRRATHSEKERMLALLRGGLEAVGALPVVQTDGYFEDWRILFQRADLSPKEIRLLEHMARRMAQASGKGPEG